MDANASVTFRHVALYGQTALDHASFSGPVPDQFTLNSPVGLCMDRYRQVWSCDTGNNRIVIFNADLTRILRILYAPSPTGSGEGARPFRLPFHICQHPDQDRMFITDMGNSRIVAMDVGPDRFRFAFAFGDQGTPSFTPLMDPNGITAVRKADGRCHLYVNDEFFRTTDDTRNRCVCFDDQGAYLHEFRSVIDPEGQRHDLYWPQGIASDAAGNIYIANTGNYEVLKCPTTAPVDNDYCIAADTPVIPHRFDMHSGIGMLNIMRYVNVIDERVFVPDHVQNAISVFRTDGTPLTTIAGIRPSWNHQNQPVDSLSDPLYYALDNAALISPYAICAGEAADLFFVSEPFTSRISKMRIDDFSLPDTAATVLAGVGGRRDEPGRSGQDPQFNCVTSVIGLHPRAAAPASTTPSVSLPTLMERNPWQHWAMSLSQTLTRQYEYWVSPWTRQLLEASRKEAGSPPCLNIDAGNWGIQAYVEKNDDFAPLPLRIDGYFLPGNLAMALYHPRTPLFGQLCPGTPLLLVSNFNVGTVSLYQVGPFGNLLNYALPFGRPGNGDGCLHGPQGMAVNDEGEVFVVDALNFRISKWQILQTGQVVFIRDFRWEKGQPTPPHAGNRAPVPAFSPTDIAIDADNRVFVTDQFNNRICVFDRQGNSLWSCGREGYWEEGEADGDRFMLPTSLTIEGEHLVVNDLVNRALKVFRIGDDTLHFSGGVSLFKRSIDNGGVWMPFFMYAHDRQLFVADSTYNVVQVYAY